MGKYEINQNYSINTKAQLYIANELAEANRLKRLELNYSYGPTFIGKKFKAGGDMLEHFEKELEDKA